jgi:hypothetical protein
MWGGGQHRVWQLAMKGGKQEQKRRGAGADTLSRDPQCELVVGQRTAEAEQK